MEIDERIKDLDGDHQRMRLADYCLEDQAPWPCEIRLLLDLLLAKDRLLVTALQLLQEGRAHTDAEHQSGCASPYCQAVGAILTDPRAVTLLAAAKEGEDE